MNRLLFFCFFLFAYHYTFSSSLVDSLFMENGEIQSKQYEYWKANYYDSIPKQKNFSPSEQQSYEDMVSRYQSKDFEYVESISKKLDFFSEFFNRIFRFFEDLFPKSDVNVNPNLFRIVAILAIIVGLFFICKYLIDNKIFIKEPKEVEEEESELRFVEKNLMQVDVNMYVDEALKNKNYSLAIRYQQLLNIQLLQKKGLVAWHSSKTNFELIENVTNEELKSDFMNCAKIFDYVWFGDFETLESDYQSYALVFEAFRRSWA